MPETRECSQSKSNFRQQNQFPFLKRQILAAAKKKKKNILEALTPQVTFSAANLLRVLRLQKRKATLLLQR